LFSVRESSAAKTTSTSSRGSADTMTQPCQGKPLRHRLTWAGTALEYRELPQGAGGADQLSKPQMRKPLAGATASEARFPAFECVVNRSTIHHAFSTDAAGIATQCESNWCVACLADWAHCCLGARPAPKEFPRSPKVSQFVKNLTPATRRPDRQAATDGNGFAKAALPTQSKVRV